ncbi:MAG TPA: serine/threonine-protein kinase [Gemmatimonadales bacterium]|nr:serine/threonine-protein kinase [Gemmatimonadales bacterium]
MKFCTACNAEYGDDILFCQRDGTPLRTLETARDLVGQIVAERYHIQKKLGEGGMGQVYLAEHVKMGRRCAIKIMAQSMMNDADAISRFNREAANASRISHPHVCAVYDFGETREGLIYLAMEYIEGKTLSALLDEGGAMPLPRAAGIISQTADALQAAHDLGIVHRDLKPDNIMVMAGRGRDIVKVVDFGIAKTTDAKSSGQKVTKTGLVVGTPEYMSPEQLSGDPCDGRSDLYSLALVFYRMITGKLPFEADSAQETMIKRLTDEPMPLALARPDLRFPALVQTVLNRSLTRSPADRYATAVEFGRDLATATASMTSVDLEAGTQVVKPEDMDRLLATVPATRVDPEIQRISQGLKTVVARAGEADKAGGAGKAVGEGGKAVKKIPVVPIAAVVLIAVAGGTYAMRGTLFGGTAIQKVDSLPAPTGSETSTVLVAKPVNTTDSQGAQTLTAKSTSNPVSGTQLPADSVRTTNPPVTTNNPQANLGALKAQVLKFADDIEFVDDAAKRAEGKQVAQRAWNTLDLGDSLRAEAAGVMGSALLKENDRDGARTWYQRANSLHAKDSWQKILDAIN